MECGNYSRFSSRREMLARVGYGLGAAALHTLFGAPHAVAAGATVAAPRAFPNFAPRAKRVIFLFQAGGQLHLATRGNFLSRQANLPIDASATVEGIPATMPR